MVDSVMKDDDLGVPVNEDYLDLANLFMGLDEWITNGGFLPDDWQSKDWMIRKP